MIRRRRHNRFGFTSQRNLIGFEQEIQSTPAESPHTQVFPWSMALNTYNTAHFNPQKMNNLSYHQFESFMQALATIENYDIGSKLKKLKSIFCVSFLVIIICYVALFIIFYLSMDDSDYNETFVVEISIAFPLMFIIMIFVSFYTKKKSQRIVEKREKDITLVMIRYNQILFTPILLNCTVGNFGAYI